MIYVGEIEFTNPGMYPDGYAGHLFVGTSVNRIEQGENGAKAILDYHYSISPYSDKKRHHLGDNFITKENLSVTEFLQRVVDMDNQIGRGVIQRFPEDAKVRLKGMTEWIVRKPLTNS